MCQQGKQARRKLEPKAFMWQEHSMAVMPVLETTPSQSSASHYKIHSPLQPCGGQRAGGHGGDCRHRPHETHSQKKNDLTELSQSL